MEVSVTFHFIWAPSQLLLIRWPMVLFQLLYSNLKCARKLPIIECEVWNAFLLLLLFISLIIFSIYVLWLYQLLYYDELHRSLPSPSIPLINSSDVVELIDGLQFQTTNQILGEDHVIYLSLLLICVYNIVYLNRQVYWVCMLRHFLYGLFLLQKIFYRRFTII